jgi:hypothetical protein
LCGRILVVDMIHSRPLGTLSDDAWVVGSVISRSHSQAFVW